MGLNRNLKAEMSRCNVTAKDIARVINKSYDTTLKKIRSEADFSRAEMFLIRDGFFPKESIDYLFDGKMERQLQTA